MNSPDRLALARSALPFIAFHNGVQRCAPYGADIELWTLRATLSPELVAGSTYAEETVLTWLAASRPSETKQAVSAGIDAWPAAANERLLTGNVTVTADKSELMPNCARGGAESTKRELSDITAIMNSRADSPSFQRLVRQVIDARHAERMECLQGRAFPTAQPNRNAWGELVARAKEPAPRACEADAQEATDEGAWGMD